MSAQIPNGAHPDEARVIRDTCHQIAQVFAILVHRMIQLGHPINETYILAEASVCQTDVATKERVWATGCCADTLVCVRVAWVRLHNPTNRGRSVEFEMNTSMHQ
jgi:hypothetical protein